MPKDISGIDVGSTLAFLDQFWKIIFEIKYPCTIWEMTGKFINFVKVSLERGRTNTRDTL